MSGLSLRPRRVLPKRAGEPGTRDWAQTLVSATIGAPRYLLGNDGALYWSPVPEGHEDDGGPCGAATYSTPMAAAVAATLNVGMVRLPEGWEVEDEPADVAAPKCIGCGDELAEDEIDDCKRCASEKAQDRIDDTIGDDARLAEART